MGQLALAALIGLAPGTHRGAFRETLMSFPGCYGEAERVGRDSEGTEGWCDQGPCARVLSLG